MKLKRSEHKTVLRRGWSCLRNIRLRLFVLIIVGLGLLAGLFVSGVWAGYRLNLWYSRKGFTVKAWGRSLLVHQLGCVKHFFQGLSVQPERIDIDIKAKDMAILEAIRQDALNKGNLFSTPDDWVSARIRYQGQSYDAAVRLKGDMPDHWYEKDGWSLKIKLKNDQTLFGMRRFSIQQPWTRWFLAEWITHRWLAYHDLIAMRYQFIEVGINGKNQSIFAVEENFDKYLIENNCFREGPILRFNNDLSWSLGPDNPLYFDNFLDASIEPGFPESALNDPAMKVIWQKAATLLEQLRTGQLAVEQVIDVDKMALYFALFELFKSDHIVSLDNMRLYYNPITSRIEPVGYDCEDIQTLSYVDGNSISGYYPEPGLYPSPNAWRRLLFCNRAFYSAYLRALERISAPGYLEAFFKAIENDQQKALAILYKGNPWYFYEDENLLKTNRDFIRSVLKTPIGPVCYLKSCDLERRQLTFQIRNLGILPVVLDSFQSGNIQIRPSQEILLYSHTPGPAKRYHEITVAISPDIEPAGQDWTNALTVRWHKMGLTETRETKVHNWPAVTDEFSGPDALRVDSTVEKFDFIIGDKDGNYRIQPGRHTLTEPLIVPVGRKLICGPGTVLDLTTQAMLISRSPLEFIGSAEDPIGLISSDKKGMGLIVMDAGGISHLEQVYFNGLSNPQNHGWSVSAAVSFYQSDVDVRDCVFRANRCEDYLNTIRCRFSLERTRFEHTAADAFDSDFSQGSMKQVGFIQCGNDAVDVSGTQIEIDDIVIEKAGDKGLSAGERSRMSVQNAYLTDCEIAVASKDDSELTIAKVAIHKSRVGFTAFQKKSEYGPGIIRATGIFCNDSLEAIMLEQGSLIEIEGQKQAWTHEKIRDLFYGELYGRKSGILMLDTDQ